MNLQIGRIPFLVCAPFFHRFFRKKEQPRDYSFIDGVPSALNKKLREGNIHLAPASSIAYAFAPQSLVLCPDICTSCNLEVQSVELFSRFPMEELSGKKIHLTSQSGTSAALLRILCSRYAHVSPKFVNSKEDCDASLLIGDEALLEKFRSRWAFRYDLAVLWKNWQGLPFVFGAWSIHKSALSNEMRPKLENFLSEVRESISDFRNDPKSALEEWSKHYPVPFSEGQLKGYYDSLDYRFTEERKESLSRYFNLCAAEGILPSAPPLHFL